VKESWKYELFDKFYVCGTMIHVVDIDQEQPDSRKQRKIRWQKMRLIAAQAHDQAKTHYAAQFDTPQQTGSRWTQAARQAGWSANTHLRGKGDGAEWIAAQFEQHFGAHERYTLELHHMREYLDSCAPPGQASYAANAREAPKQNQNAKVIEELAGRLEPESEPEENAPVRRAHRYPDKRREQLDYQNALERDLPVGSGIIESGPRRALQARLKILKGHFEKLHTEAAEQR